MAKEKGSKQGKPEPTKVRKPTKTRKSPRGKKTERVVDQLLSTVMKPTRRHRNDHNRRMAQVAKLARML